jgi:hypothetical protein
VVQECRRVQPVGDAIEVGQDEVAVLPVRHGLNYVVIAVLLISKIPRLRRLTFCLYARWTSC